MNKLEKLLADRDALDAHIAATEEGTSRKKPRSAAQLAQDARLGAAAKARGGRALDAAEAEGALPSTIDNLRALLGGERADRIERVSLYRNRDGGRLGWCGDYAPQTFLQQGLELVRREWGPGDYTVRLYERGSVPVASDRLTIEGALVAPVVEQHSPGTDVARVLETLAANQQALMDALVAQRNQPAPDPLANMQAMLGMMGMMRSAMGLDQQPTQKSSIAEIVQAVRDLRSVSEEINPPKEDDSLMGSLPKMLDIVHASIQQQAAHAPATNGVPTVTLPPTLVQSDPPTGPEPAPSEPAPGADETEPLRDYLLLVLARADRGDSPEAVAEAVYYNGPDIIMDVLDSPGWLDLLCAFEPRCEPHREWLARLGACCKTLDADDDEAPAGEAGISTPNATRKDGFPGAW